MPDDRLRLLRRQPQRLRSRWIAAAVLASSASCAKGPLVHSYWESGGLDEPIAEEEATPAPAPAPAPAPSELAQQMHEQFAALDAMRLAVIAGDQGRAFRISETLLEEVEAVAPHPEWTSFTAQVTRELKRFDPTKSLPDAAHGLARLTAACGACHAAQGVAPDFPEFAMPHVGHDETSVMLAHRWAAERMWEGLVGPSDDRWRSGSSTFVSLPGCEAVHADRSEAVRSRCTHAVHVARRAHLADAPAERAELYGLLLETCSDCHDGVRRDAGTAASIGPPR